MVVQQVVARAPAGHQHKDCATGPAAESVPNISSNHHRHCEQTCIATALREYGAALCARTLTMLVAVL